MSLLTLKLVKKILIFVYFFIS